MGTPAFPNLGKHCFVDECRQIDFLPFICDRCKQVFCLEHRSYGQHRCPHGDNHGVTVVICPLCAKGVRLLPEEDPNIAWDKHVNTACDPSNYEKATKKKKCPVAGCREILVFSNTIKCRDCTLDHCLKHRFGPDHKCPGPRKSNTFQFLSLLTPSRKENPRPNRAAAQPSSAWSRLVDATTAGMAKLSTEFNQAFQPGEGSGSSGKEVCPQCNARFSSVVKLVEHVEKVHGKGNNRGTSVRKVTIDVCPKCSKGFRDPVALVEHVERDHGGTSKA